MKTYEVECYQIGTKYPRLILRRTWSPFVECSVPDLAPGPYRLVVATAAEHEQHERDVDALIHAAENARRWHLHDIPDAFCDDTLAAIGRLRGGK
jgi:hypothetical protein